MSQDQIAKLMAVAGRSAASQKEPTLSLPTSVAGADPAMPPLLGALPPLAEKVSQKNEPAPRDAEDQPSRRVARRRPAGPVRGKIAANDDVPSIGGLIYALEQKPSRKIFRWAALGSVVWTTACLVIGGLTLAPQWQAGASLGVLLLNPTTLYTAVAILGPIGIIWLLALLNWHVASLALKSSTMSEVAIRLAEPDRAAEQSIASLGQAVRRQVSFMNDAVSRALGRAGELEALVHNHVAELERSYEQNEQRIRDLIKELGGERDALLNTSVGVTDTLKTLGTEIPALIERLSTQQLTLKDIITHAGENLASLEGSLATATGRFEGAVGSRTHELQSVLQDYTSAFSEALGARTEQMRLTFDGYIQTLDTSLGDRTERLQSVFQDYARVLDNQLVERSQALDQSFHQRLALFDDQIHRSTLAIDGAVAEKASLLTNALELHSRSFRETIAQQAADLDDSVMNGINAVRRTSENITRQTMRAIEGLSKQSGTLQNVAENLFSQIHNVTGRFENQGEQILKAATVLDHANMRVDSALQNRHAELTHTLDKLSGKADEFGRTIAGYSNDLEGSLSGIEARARAIADELRDGARSHSRDLMAELERVKTETEAYSDRALNDLRNRFNSVSGELSREFDALSSKLTSASDETRRRAADAAATLAREQARIRDEATRLPTTARETAETMRRSLQDQLRAIEQLSQISQRANASRDVIRPDAGRPDGVGAQTVPPIFAQPLTQQETNPSRGRPAGAPAAAPGPGDGWSLGDLLARASSHDDDAQRATQGAGQPSLGGGPVRLDVTMIARSLDAATAASIWSRIRAGQRNVLVRSIYTPEARALFDQISSRIRTNTDLEQSVMRYLSDFERIIKDAEARDPSGRLSQGHLVADPGRVYLFLAHAAGRIN